MKRAIVAATLIAIATLATIVGCMSHRQPGSPLTRNGDEIVACGEFFHVGAPVVLWTDPGGYDAYRIQPRFASTGPSTFPADFNQRVADVAPEEMTLGRLRQVVDQFVIHYDNSGVSRECFRTLHDRRNLSVHFMLDLDGTIYQTLDLKERAWHATTSNSRSIGIEIANAGAFEWRNSPALPRWYSRDAGGRTRIVIPRELGDGGIRTPNFVARPTRDEIVSGTIQGKLLYQYDFTPQQYASLAKLTAALCKILPKIRCDFPRDASGRVITQKLDDGVLQNYTGLLGHYHIQANKEDPGPAFQWDKLIRDARAQMH